MVLDRSLRQTIQVKYSLRVYTCKIEREITALTLPFRAVKSPARAKRGQENDKEHGALRHLPKPALAPDAAPPPCTQIHTQGHSQPKPDTRVTRDLAPPVKGRVRPHWAPKAAPRRRGRFPTWPPPGGRGTAPRPRPNAKKRLTPTAHAARWGSYALRTPLIQDPRQAWGARSHKRLRSSAQTLSESEPCPTVSEDPGVSTGDMSAEHGTSFPKMPCPTRHEQWMGPLMLKHWQYCGDPGLCPCIYLFTLHSIDLDSRLYKCESASYIIPESYTIVVDTQYTLIVLSAERPLSKGSPDSLHFF
jgi:hypothetical protein